MSAFIPQRPLSRNPHRPRAGGWAWLVLLAVILRGLIPTGYMVSPVGGTGLLMPCPAMDPHRVDGHASIAHLSTVHVDRQTDGTGHTQPHPDDSRHQPMGPCAFAGLAALLVPVLLALVQQRPPVRQRWAPLLRVRAPLQRAAGDPRARAPPRLMARAA